jgi:hypothetical protein
MTVSACASQFREELCYNTVITKYILEIFIMLLKKLYPLKMYICCVVKRTVNK